MEPDKKILIVEDDDFLRNTLKDLFAKKYKVDTAANGEEAVDKIFVGKPNLVLLDLLLPKLDGFTVLARMRSYPDPEVAVIPVVVLSNLSSNADILKAENWKVQGYLVKANNDLDQISQKVEQVLNAPKAPEARLGFTSK